MSLSISHARYRIYRLKWKYYPKINLVSSFPFHVDIETTDACNLHCIMCVHGTEGVKNPGMINFDFAMSLIDQIAYFGAYSVKFNWRGEPALYKWLVDLVRYAKYKGILEVQFNTNGIPYDDKKIQDLISAGLDRVIFSMDGATKDTYEKIRVGASYERLIHNVKSFNLFRKELNKAKPLIRIQMVKMKENKDEVKDFIKMWKPFVDDIQVNNVTNRGQGNILSAGDKIAVGRKMCPQPWQRMVIAHDGKVLPCCADWRMRWVIGDATREDLRSIWLGNKMNEIRKLIRENKLDKFEPCKSCFAAISYNWKDVSRFEKH